MILRPHPRRAPADIMAKAAGAIATAFQRFLRLFASTELAESGGEPTISFGIGRDRIARLAASTAASILARNTVPTRSDSNGQQIGGV
jgi:hypothetical protein